MHLVKAKNGNLGIFEAVEANDAVFIPRHCLHQNVAIRIENLNMQSLSPCNKPLGVTARQITWFHASLKSPKKESWVFSKLSKTMVPSIHQGNVYIKR